MLFYFRDDGKDGIYRLPAFETSDVHGYIASKDGDNYKFNHSYISDKVKDVRGYGDSYNKDYALPVDAGDIYQGNTMSNLLNGAPVSIAYELMGYDAVTVGNHEFDRGIENMIDLVLGCHSHETEQGVTDNGIFYMEPNKYGVAYNSFELVFERKNKKISFRQANQMLNNDIPAAKTLHIDENSEDLGPDIAEVTEAAIEQIRSVLEKNVGYITTEAKKKGFIDGSGKMATTGGNWVSSVYKRAVNADVTFVNRGGIRFDFVLKIEGKYLKNS
ncbi:MAG: hypothetical protein IKR11_10850 [Solobacterium sp.]|nr:hypothetical protein [Solobacterium sp.]